MILKNFDEANQYIDYGNNENTINKQITKINGWYKKNNNELTALFVSDFTLYILVNEKKYEIKENFCIKLKKGENKDEKILELLDNNHIILSFRYSIDLNIGSISPFEYIDGEDNDWGLFIQNRVNNLQKKNNFIQILME